MPAVQAVRRSLVAQELLVQRGLDLVARTTAPIPPADLTVLVKTFERPHVLRRLVKSVRRLHPALPIIAVDDSAEPTRLPGVMTIEMPYDSGVSAGRNEGLRHVATPFVLLMDDDFVFFRHTGLDAAMRLMARQPEIDIMGGQVIDLPFHRRRQPPRGRIYVTPAKPRVPLGSRLGGLEVVDKVPNFFLARRDRLELVPWDPQLKLAEHADFFTRALGTLTTVFNPGLRCLHATTPYDRAYMSKRMDYTESIRVLEPRYGAGARVRDTD